MSRLDDMRLWNNPMPVCPYCEAEQRCVADIMTHDELEHEGTTMDCRRCERTFRVFGQQSMVFTTSKLEGRDAP